MAFSGLQVCFNDLHAYYKYTAPTGEINEQCKKKKQFIKNKKSFATLFQPELDSVWLFATLFVFNYSFGSTHLQ